MWVSHPVLTNSWGQGMNDICERLNLAAVQAHPLILEEARHMILRLREDYDRVQCWNHQLQRVVADQAAQERVDGR